MEEYIANLPDPNILYFFCVKSVDAVGNISEISNCRGDFSSPVVLSVFTATALDEKIQLYWVTESETDNLGWNIYRSNLGREGYHRINRNLIPGAGNSSVPVEYFYSDENVSEGVTYYYYLESVSYAGEITKFFVISATAE